MPEPVAPVAVCAGYMPLDIIVRGRQVWRRAGGTAGNVSAILAFLGWRSMLAGRVGEDEAGAELVGDLQAAGVDCELLQQDPGGDTNRLVHRIGAPHHRYQYTCPCCDQRLPRSRPLVLSQAEEVVSAVPAPAVYFFDRANVATVRLAELYASAGALIVFEPSTPANARLLQRALAAARIVKSSDEHGPSPKQSPIPRADQVRIVTSGVGGARFRVGDGPWLQFTAHVVPTMVDAAGAGDWMTAAIIDGIARTRARTEEAIGAALEVGQSLAALNCGLPGARALMEHRTRNEVLGLAAKLREDGEYPVLETAPIRAAPIEARCAWCVMPIARDDVALTAL